MNSIQKGKAGLIVLSIIILALGLIAFGGGIACVVVGAQGIGGDMSTVGIVFAFIGGVALIVVGAIMIVASIVMLWTGSAIKAKHGNIAEGNLGIGTVNMAKCQKCGMAVNPQDTNCSNCGASLLKTKKCSKCGAEIDAQSKHCSKCGAQV